MDERLDHKKSDLADQLREALHNIQCFGEPLTKMIFDNPKQAFLTESQPNKISVFMTKIGYSVC
jgi:hypothetical protein